MDAMAMQLRHALRRLRRAPVFTLATVSTVALGIAAFAAIFSVVNGVLLKPLPYRDAGDLIWVWRNYTWIGLERGWLGGPDIVALRERTDVFEGVAEFRSASYNLTGADGSAPEEAQVLLASDEFFTVLGASPTIGRGFVEGDDDPQAAGVVVLGYDLWQRRYGGDRSIVGRDIYLDGSPSTVVGITGPDFHFVKHSSLGDPVPADLYATDQVDLASRPPGQGSFAGLARVKPGVKPAAVEAAIATVGADLDRAYMGSRGLKLWGVGLEEDLVGKARPALRALLGAALFLLLILGANLAALLFGRAGEREREIAVRRALGSGRAGALFNLAGESLLVAAAGGAIGLVLAFWATRALVSMAPETLPRRADISIDAMVIAVTMAGALAMGLIAGIPAALRAMRQPAEAVLRASTGRAGGGIATGRTRRLLVVGQVALSLMLLVGAALVARSFAALLRSDGGFDPEGVITFRVPLGPQDYPSGENILAFNASLREKLQAMPGVRAVGSVDGLPLSAGANQTVFAFPGAPGNTGDAEADVPLLDYMAATPGYFEALRIPLVSGRAFDERDSNAAPQVAIIDETLASQFFPNSDPVGQIVIGNSDTMRIVGVAAHARLYTMQADDRGQIYKPFTQMVRRQMSFAVRSSRPEAVADAIIGTVHSLDPRLPVSDLRSMDDIVRASLGQERLSFWLLSGFGACALLLAALGIYGVVSSGVTRRTHEVGVRLALGADRRQVLGLVIREGIGAAALGVGLGVVGAAFSSRLLRSQLFGLGPSDPPTYAAVIVALLGVAVIAAWVPARRATRIAPAEALRVD
jgi:putative ABC transport system permease protein